MIYFSPHNYPELKSFAKKERKKEIETFLIECPKAKAYLTYPLIVVIVPVITFISAINEELFGQSNILLSAVTGGVIGGLGALIVLPFFSSGPIRKLFVPYWGNRNQQEHVRENLHDGQ